MKSVLTSGQVGFSVASKIQELENDKVRSGRATWKAFRELMVPKWTGAFFDAVQSETGSATFTYVTAVTAIHGDAALWEHHPRFQQALKGNPIKLLSAATIFAEVADGLSTTVASSSLGRIFQLLKASGYLRQLGEGGPTPAESRMLRLG